MCALFCREILSMPAYPHENMSPAGKRRWWYKSSVRCVCWPLGMGCYFYSIYIISGHTDHVQSVLLHAGNNTGSLPVFMTSSTAGTTGSSLDAGHGNSFCSLCECGNVNAGANPSMLLNCFLPIVHYREYQQRRRKVFTTICSS